MESNNEWTCNRKSYSRTLKGTYVYYVDVHIISLRMMDLKSWCTYCINSCLWIYVWICNAWKHYFIKKLSMLYLDGRKLSPRGKWEMENKGTTYFLDSKREDEENGGNGKFWKKTRQFSLFFPSLPFPSLPFPPCNIV